MSKFLKIYFSLIILTIIVFHFVVSNTNIDFSNIEFAENNNYHYNPNSKLNWPLFGYYNISSYFGKRKAPTSRGFYLSHWHRYSCSSWNKYICR